MVDAASSNIYRPTYARILVEIDVSKGLPEKIKLASPHGSWIQLLGYEDIPFRCRKCHMTGHLAAHCSYDKVRSKKSPSWWLGVSNDQYTVQKVSTVVDESVCSSLANLDEVSIAAPGDLNVVPLTVDTSLVDGSSPVANSVDSFAIPLADLSQKVDVCPFFVIDSGQNSVAGAFPGARVLGVSGDWQKAAGKVEDGWTSVKGKKRQVHQTLI